MPHVPKPFPYKLLDKYPGMRPEDEVLWDEYVKNHPNRFDTVWYNVHVGEPIRDDIEKNAAVATGAYSVSQWCVDVIAISGLEYYVIEIKPNALAGALGQALAYTRLLQHEKSAPDYAQPIVLTDNISPITEQAAYLLGVGVWIP